MKLTQEAGVTEASESASQPITSPGPKNQPETPPETQPEASAAKNALKAGLKITFAVALITWMIQKGALDLALVRAIATPALILSLSALLFTQFFINNYRWLLLLRSQGLQGGVSYTLPLTFIGLFFNFVMPGGVGGDVVKGYYLLQDHPQKRGVGAISILMDRLVGFFVMVATAFFALFLNWDAVSHSRELKSVAVSVSLLFLAFVSFFVLALSRRMGRRVLDSALGRLIFERLPGSGTLKKVYDYVHQYRRNPDAVVKAILLSAVTQVPNVGFVYLVAQAMGVHEIPLSVYFFLVPVGMVILALPISPAGIGVGQAAFYFLFSLYLGTASKLGATAVTLFQVLNFGWGLVGAYFYLMRRRPIVTSEVG